MKQKCCSSCRVQRYEQVLKCVNMCVTLTDAGLKILWFYKQKMVVTRHLLLCGREFVVCTASALTRCQTCTLLPNPCWVGHSKPICSRYNLKGSQWNARFRWPVVLPGVRSVLCVMLCFEEGGVGRDGADLRMGK
jgi:hypothetical protein